MWCCIGLHWTIMWWPVVFMYSFGLSCNFACAVLCSELCYSLHNCAMQRCVLFYMLCNILLIVQFYWLPNNCATLTYGAKVKVTSGWGEESREELQNRDDSDRGDTNGRTQCGGIKQRRRGMMGNREKKGKWRKWLSSWEKSYRDWMRRYAEHKNLNRVVEKRENIRKRRRKC